MIGVGRTVFAGTKLEDFKVDMLGVMRNVIGPKRNLILARLEGGPLAKTGVIAGMSGSPVYVDGKLMGAVSYSLGQFSTEPIAGITPIAEMIDATMMAGAARVTRPVAMSLHPTPRELLDIWSRDLGRVAPFVDDAVAGAGAVRRVRRTLSRMSAMLRPIAVPMIASGFDAVGVRRRSRRRSRRPASCRCRARSRPAPAHLAPPTRVRCSPAMRSAWRC